MRGILGEEGKCGRVCQVEKVFHCCTAAMFRSVNIHSLAATPLLMLSSNAYPPPSPGVDWCGRNGRQGGWRRGDVRR